MRPNQLKILLVELFLSTSRQQPRRQYSGDKIDIVPFREN